MGQITVLLANILYELQTPCLLGLTAPSSPAHWLSHPVTAHHGPPAGLPTPRVTNQGASAPAGEAQITTLTKVRDLCLCSHTSLRREWLLPHGPAPPHLCLTLCFLPARPRAGLPSGAPDFLRQNGTPLTWGALGGAQEGGGHQPASQEAQLLVPPPRSTMWHGTKLLQLSVSPNVK